MEQLATVVMDEIREELGEDTVNTVKEPSAFIRYMQIKYKCLIIFVAMFLISQIFFYTAVKDAMRDEEGRELLTQMISMFSNIYFQNETVHPFITKKNET